MENKVLLIVIAVAVIILAVAGFVAFKQLSAPPQNQPVDDSVSVPASFNLIFKYGILAKNELNTFNQTYTKDMIEDPPVTINFKLSDSELAGISQKISDLKLFDITQPIIEEELMVSVSPCSSYYLKAQIGSKEKEMSWDNCRGEVNDKLQQFTKYIISIIESKEEYKKLPAPTGGYM